MFVVGDLISQEIRYHLIWYSSFTYCPVSSTSFSESDRNACIAFAEVCMYIEESDIIVHRLSDLMMMCDNAYCQIACCDVSDLKLNQTRFKNQLLENIPQLSEYKSGREVLLSFEKDVTTALRQSMSERVGSETMTLVKAAKIIRRSMEEKSSVSLSQPLMDFGNQEDAVPDHLLTLVQLILTGSSNSTARQQESQTISQLIMTNSIKRPSTKLHQQKL